jgi:hypothetical protein
MSDDDLLKKREGTFITGLPDFHLIQLQVLVLVSEAMYIGMENEQILFCIYTLFSKVKANVAYYTSNARVNFIFRYSL